MQKNTTPSPFLFLSLCLLCLCLLQPRCAAAAPDGYTRGIGVYPGRSSEMSAPRLVRDTLLRNVALDRQAMASSSTDYNLTAQLVTDGIRMPGLPPLLTVSTRQGVISDRDKEKSIDGNTVTSNTLMGENPWLQYDWQRMGVTLDTLRFVAQVAYDAGKATGGFDIRVLGSDDGRRWTVIGQSKGKDLPGYKAAQTVSTDPNKAEDAIRLPLRKVKMAVPLSKGGTYSHLRVVFGMKGAAWWRVYEVDGGALRYRQDTWEDDKIRWGSTNGSWLPSSRFFSAWVADKAAAAREAQWVTVDLGATVDVESARIDWLYPAKEGRVQVSDDNVRWRDVAQLDGSAVLSCPCRGRYLRLWLSKPSAEGTYGIRELEVWGRGGLHAEPAAAMPATGGKTFLGGWQLRRDGDSRWIPATVPATVLGSYMDIGAVPDNRVADNMRQISESFFNSDFIYRTTFDCQPSMSHQYLHFDGINWKAQVWLNGVLLGSIDGAFKQGRFDITQNAKAHGNVLEVRIIKNAHIGAVKIKNASTTDLNGGVLGADNPTFHPTVGWDWITSTPGRNIGIWNDVYLTEDNGVGLSAPIVTTTLDMPDTLATITPSVLVENNTGKPREVVVKGHVGNILFSKTIRLAAKETQEVAFAPTDYPQLQRQSMRLWWPNGYGEPYLYDAGFSVSEDSVVSAEISFKAGLRQMGYDSLATRVTLYVNGKRVDPLGGNWGFPETNLNYRGREYEAAVGYHRDMHFNMIRNWVGQTGDDEFYEACDRNGILVWQDFWLANPWDGPDPDDEQMFLDNSLDLIRRIRRHPSIGIYCGRNEGYPPATIDKALRRQIARWHPQLGYISSSADDGVSGHGPYWLNPSAYYFSHQSGKLHSEQGMPNVPNYESLCRMLASDSLWPQGDAWGQHDFTQQGAQRGRSFDDIMQACFGTPRDARQFSKWAQWLNYDGHRAMFEAAQQQRQGLIMWMSHPCWPSMVWQTYDYYLEPTAAYFGIKKACEPLHIQFNPVRKAVEVVNVGVDRPGMLTSRIDVFDMEGKPMATRTAPVAVDRDQTVEAMPVTLPADAACCLRLTLTDSTGRTVSSNFYVEAPQPSMMRSVLASKARLAVRQEETSAEGGTSVRVTVANDGSAPAFLIRLLLKGDDGGQILPVLYEDNYFSLMPGESRTVTIGYREEDARGCRPVVEATAFND